MAQMLVSPSRVPATYYAATGYVLHQWALLEFYLEQVMSILLHRIGPKEGRLVFSQLNARPKIEVYRALVDKKCPDGEVKKAAQWIGKNAAHLNGIRNKIVHGRWSHPVGKPRTIVLYYVGGSSDNRWMPKPYRAKAATVKNVGKMIEDMNKVAIFVVTSLRGQLPLPDISLPASPQENPHPSENP